MRRLLLVAASVFVMVAGTAGAVPGMLEDVCACGGLKLPLGGYPISGSWWECQYLVNGQTVVTEYHVGGCP